MQILIQKFASGQITKKFFLKWFMEKARTLFQSIQKNLSKKEKLLLSTYLKKLTPYYQIQAADKEDYRALVKLEEYNQYLINIEKIREEKKPHDE